ncbi:hypothetical protein CSUI_003374 [Cystoisospora suis]|uniref:Uncharacterized protein n=1 Tax=Cystoisospora suis TaxID=483139 RepID=A0A2C6L4J7_9APIC|nr:hypothetical protein CSUI_003374 [Cystoisospora suis]
MDQRRESEVNTVSSYSSGMISSRKPHSSLSAREEEEGREGEEGTQASEEWIRAPSPVLKRLAKAPWAARLLREMKEIEKKGMVRRRKKKEDEAERREKQESKRGEQDGELDQSQDKTGRGMLSLGGNAATEDLSDDWEMRFWWYQNAPRLFISTVRQHATSEPSVQLRMLELLLVRTPLLSVVRSEQAGRTGWGREGEGGEESACRDEQEVREDTSSVEQDSCDRTEAKTIEKGAIQQKTEPRVEERREESFDTNRDRSSAVSSLPLDLLPSCFFSASPPSLASDASCSGKAPNSRKRDCENVEIREEDVEAFGPGFVLFSQDPRFPVEHRLWCVDQFVFFLGHSCRSASLQQVEDKYHEKEKEEERKLNRRTKGGKGSSSSSLEGSHHCDTLERETGPCHSSSSSLSSSRSRTDPQEGGDEIRAGHRISPSGFLMVSDIRVWRVLAASVKWLAGHGYFEFAARITYTLLTFIYDIRAFPAPYPSSSFMSVPPATRFSHCLSSERQQETASEGLDNGENFSRSLSRPSIANGRGETSQLRPGKEEEEGYKQEFSQTAYLAGERDSGSRGDAVSLLEGKESKMSRRKREEDLIRKRNDRWKVPKHLWLQTLGMRHHSRHVWGASPLSASSAVSSKTPLSSSSSVGPSSSSSSSHEASGAFISSEHPKDSHSLSHSLSRHSQMLVPSLEPHETDAVDLVDDLFLTLKNEATQATALLARAILFLPSSSTSPSSLSSSSPSITSSSSLTRVETGSRGGVMEVTLQRKRGKRGKEANESQEEEEGEKNVRAQMTARLASKFAPSDDRGRGVGAPPHSGEDRDIHRSSRDLMKRYVVVKKIGLRSPLSSPTEDLVHHRSQDIHLDSGLIDRSIIHHVQHPYHDTDVCLNEWNALELCEEVREGTDFSSGLQNASLIGCHHLPHQLREQQTTGRGNLIRREGAYSPAFGFTCLAWYLRLESIFYRVQDMSLTSLACRLLTHFIKHGEPQRLFPYSPPPSSSPSKSLPTSLSTSRLAQSSPSMSVSSSSSSPASMAPSSSFHSHSSQESTSISSPSSCRSPLLSVRSPLALLSPSSRPAASPSGNSLNSTSTDASFFTSSSSSSLLISPVGATALANIVGSLKAVRLYEHDLLSQICKVLQSHLSLLPAHIICELMYNVGCLGFTDPSFADAVSSYLVHSNVLKDVKTDWIMQVLIGFTRLDLRDENLIAACIEGLLSSPSITPTRNDTSASSLRRVSQPTSLSSSSPSPSSDKGDEDVLHGDLKATSVSRYSAEVAGSSAGPEEHQRDDGSQAQALPSQYCRVEKGGQREGPIGNEQNEEDAPRRKTMMKKGSSHYKGHVSPVSSSLQGAASILARTQRPASLFYLLHGISFNNVRSLRLLSSLLPALHKYASTVPVNVVVLGFHDIIRMSIWPGPLRGAIVPNLMRNLHRLSLATLASSSMLCWSFWGHFDVPLLLCLVKQFRLRLLEESSLSLSPSSSSLLGEGRNDSGGEDDEDRSSSIQHPSTVRDQDMKETMACSSLSIREPLEEAISQRKTSTEKKSLSVEKLKNSGGGTAKTITLVKASTQLWSSLYGIEVLSLTPRDFISSMAIDKDSRTYLQEGKDHLRREKAFKNTCQESSWGRDGDNLTIHSSSLSRGGSITSASPAGLLDTQAVEKRSPSPLSYECSQDHSLLPLSLPSSFSSSARPSYCRDDTKPPLSSSPSPDLATSVSATLRTSTGAITTATTMKANMRSSVSSTHPTTRLYVSAFLSSRSSAVPSLPSSSPPGILFSPWRTGSLQGLKLAKLLEIPESQWTPKSSSFHEEVLAALSTCVRGKLINEQAVGPYGIDIVVPPKAMACWRDRKHEGEKVIDDDGGEEKKKAKKTRSEQQKKSREKDEKKTKEPKKRVKVSHA